MKRWYPFVALVPTMTSAAVESDECPALIALTHPPPAYPALERPFGTAGYVVVRFTIERDGTVHDPHVVEARSEPRSARWDRAFASNAASAVLGWRYEKREEPCIATVILEFMLDDAG